MICAARQDANPAAVTCNAALGGGKAVCACGAVVKGELTEARTARVPDSAREATGGPLGASEVTGG